MRAEITNFFTGLLLLLLGLGLLTTLMFPAPLLLGIGADNCASERVKLGGRLSVVVRLE